MGDRANFGFRQADKIIWVYQHWGGDGMLGSLAQAIPKDMHLQRADTCIANTMCSLMLNYGGYSEVTVNYLSDNEHSLPVVDYDVGTVSLYPKFDGNPTHLPTPKFTMSIEDFVVRYTRA